MFAEIMTVFGEILATMIEEVEAAPMRMVAEVVQFAILILIVWVVAIGFGKRRGFVVNMLAERRESMSGRIEEALASESMLAAAKHEAGAEERTARAEARRVLAEAAHDAEQVEAEAKAAADAEADIITARAKSALDTEREEMELELRERLIDTVAAATRSIMNEQMTVSEQRTLIEGAILGSIGPNGRKPATRRAEKVRA